jgi:hypothetical protein
VGQPRLRLGIVAQNARTKAESIHDRGKGGLGSGGISPHFDAGSPTPEGKKVVRWSEKLEEVGEYSDDEEVVELTPETGDTGGRGP